jgi:hypothetical protein
MPFPAMSPQDAAMLRLNHNAAAAAAVGLHPHHHPHHPAVSGGDSPFSPFPSPLPPSSMADSRGGSGEGVVRPTLPPPPPQHPHGPPPPFAAGLPPHHLPMGAAGAAHLMSSLGNPAAQVKTGLHFSHYHREIGSSATMRPQGRNRLSIWPFKLLI